MMNCVLITTNYVVWKTTTYQLQKSGKIFWRYFFLMVVKI
jgi:hypothetical protein